jgi:hypothetical protein
VVKQSCNFFGSLLFLIARQGEMLSMFSFLRHFLMIVVIFMTAASGSISCTNTSSSSGLPVEEIENTQYFRCSGHRLVQVRKNNRVFPPCRRFILWPAVELHGVLACNIIVPTSLMDGHRLPNGLIAPFRI